MNSRLIPTSILSILLLSSCSVLWPVSSWDTKPAVIDSGTRIHVNKLDDSSGRPVSDGHGGIVTVAATSYYFENITNARELYALIVVGNSIRDKSHKLQIDYRDSLDKTSGGNYAAGLIGAGVALSSHLHPDAIRGAGFLGATHVALSTRLSPQQYLTELQKISESFSCLNSATLKQMKAQSSLTSLLESEQKKKGADQNLLFISSANNVVQVDPVTNPVFLALREGYLKTLELGQAHLDSIISLSSPESIRADLINKIQESEKAKSTNEKNFAAKDLNTAKDALNNAAEVEVDIVACQAKL